MFKYCLHLTYDGTNYSGWQIQPNALSIQQLIQEALAVLIREPVSLVGSGRTDAGVHAQDQAAHFTCSTEQDVHKLCRSLNGMLPKDIRCLRICQVALSFHAQKSAIKKEYHYVLCLGPIVPPFQRLYCHHIPYAIDLSLLHEAALLFTGTHDFSSFANSQHHGSAGKNPVRTIYRLDLVEWEYGIRLEFEGNGFLYKMVRNIVGMLIAVAAGKKALSDIPRLFAAKDRRQAPLAAPARGLFLIQAHYTSSKLE